MSEEILKALTQLFAIITKQDGGVTEKERQFVIGFFQQELDQDSIKEYLELYDKFVEYKKKVDPKDYFNKGNVQGGLVNNPLGKVGLSFPGFSLLFNDGDRIAAISALAEITDVNVISSPQLMVLNNHTASLQVGDQVPHHEAMHRQCQQLKQRRT